MTDRLAAARESGRKLLVPFLTASYPDRSACAQALAGMSDAGADVIELGVPFSDPLADGPIIAAASERALRAGATLSDTIALGAEHRAQSTTPLVLFTYLNPLIAYGLDRVAPEVAESGFDGVLVADLPFDEAPDVSNTLEGQGLPLIRLAAPTTPIERLTALAEEADGFVYLIARTGITGRGSGADRRLREQVAAIRSVSPLSVVIGFGIADAESAKRVAELADGVVVGSALVERMGREGAEAAIEMVVKLRAALDSG